MARRVAAGSVAWVPPDHEACEAPAGEYRVTDQDGALTDQRAVWVDEAPGDASDGAGHFELHDESEDYDPQPVRTRLAEEAGA